MDDADLMRWADDGGREPDEDGDEPDWGPPPFRAYHGWWLTYQQLRRLFL